MNSSQEIYILDSFALLAYLGDEPGRERLEKLLIGSRRGDCTLLLCMINFGEILYMTERRRGLVKAQSVQALIENLPIKILDATRNLILDAAHIKANFALSYADAFVVAIAQLEGGIILTGDPEFQVVENKVKIEWLVK